MTIAVDWDVKPQTTQPKSTKFELFPFEHCVHFQITPTVVCLRHGYGATQCILYRGYCLINFELLPLII